MILCRVALTALVAGLTCGAQPLQGSGPNLLWEGDSDGSTIVSVQAWSVVTLPLIRSRYRQKLPLSDVREQNVLLHIRRGDCVRVIQQPRKRNGNTAKLQIKSRQPTRSYFELSYYLYPHSWFDAPNDWWDTRDVVQWRGRGGGRLLLTCHTKSCQVTPEDSPTTQVDRFDFELGLPAEASTVVLTDIHASGPITVAEQPKRENNYRVTVSMNLSSDSEYAFSLIWKPLHRDEKTQQ